MFSQEPVLGWVVDFQAFDQAARFGGSERLVETRRVVGVELIHDQDDLLGGGVEFIAERLDDGGKVEPRAPLAHQRMARSEQRRIEHEHVAGSGAPVLEIAPQAPARLGRQGCARVGDQFAARFVQADERTARINGLGVNFQHIFHASHEGGVGLGRDDPLLP